MCSACFPANLRVVQCFLCTDPQYLYSAKDTNDKEHLLPVRFKPPMRKISSTFCTSIEQQSAKENDGQPVSPVSAHPGGRSTEAFDMHYTVTC
jgi:hypothetical protein